MRLNIVLLLTMLAFASHAHAQELDENRAGAPAQTENPLTLDEALRLAAENNEIPHIAQARVDRARALRRQAYGALLPNLTLTGTYTRRSEEITRMVGDEEALIQARNALSGSAVVQTEIFRPSAIPMVRAANQNIEASEQQAEDLKRRLSYDVAETYVAVLSAEQLQHAAEQRLEVGTAILNEARSRFDAGLAGRNDVTRSELELATARFQLTEVQNALRQTRLALEYLINAPLDRPLVEPSLAEADPEDPSALEAEAHGQRPDLLAQEAIAESFRLRSQAPWLELFPSLSLRGTYRGTNEAGLGQAADWNVAAIMTWVLYDGGIRYARAAAERADHRGAHMQANQLRRQINLQIASALTDLDTADAALEQAEIRARVARQNAEEIQERFTVGLATALEQADALASGYEAEAELARQRLALHTARLSLTEALGRWPRTGDEVGE